MFVPTRTRWLALEAVALLLHMAGHVLHADPMQVLAIVLAAVVFGHHVHRR